MDWSLVACGSYGCVFKNGGKAYKVGRESMLDGERLVCHYVRGNGSPRFQRNLVLADWDVKLDTASERKLRCLMRRLGDDVHDCLGADWADLIIGAMPYIPLTLFRLVTQHTYDPASAETVVAGLMCGVRYLHRKRLAHFDLSPTNILLDVEREVGGALRVRRSYITDFGCALRMEESNWGDKFEAAIENPAVTSNVRPPEMMGYKETNTDDYFHPFTYKPTYLLRVVDAWSVGVLCDLVYQGAYDREKSPRWLVKPRDVKKTADDARAARRFAAGTLSKSCLGRVVIENFLVCNPYSRATPSLIDPEDYGTAKTL